MDVSNVLLDLLLTTLWTNHRPDAKLVNKMAPNTKCAYYAGINIHNNYNCAK